MIFILTTVAVATIFYFFYLNYQYWKKRGVPGPKPTFLLGNLGSSFFLKKSPSQIYQEIYNEYQNVPVVGVFRATSPALIVRDPELIREITVKSFSNFHDNDVFVDKKADPLFGRNPFVLRGEEWKSTRQLLTPGFTSGKMKWIYPLLEETSRKLVKFIEEQPTAVNGQGYEAKQLCMRFTLNNVGSCAFGLNAKCFEEENPEFKQIADKFLSPGGFQTLKIFFLFLIPFLTKILSVKFIPNDVEEKLTAMISHTVKYRDENNIVRNDFLHILNQLKKTSNSFTDIDITAHSAGFFGDGYESSSIVMSFLLYELAANPETQSRLREEVNDAFQQNNGELPFEALQEIEYLDAAINENLRLHPVLGFLGKTCTKPYVYTPKPGDNIKKSFTIEKGTTILLPVYGLHRDPKYFEEPDQFKPERFMKANKENITKYTFLPFGEGPRACLGQRFGVLQVKIGVAYIIKNYEISVNKKTQEPIVYDPLYFMTLAKGGLWLDFKKIS